MPNYRPPPIRLTARTRLTPLPNTFNSLTISTQAKPTPNPDKDPSKPKLTQASNGVLITELNFEEDNSIGESSQLYESGINLKEKYDHSHTQIHFARPSIAKTRHLSQGSAPGTDECHYTFSAFKYPDNTHKKPKLSQLKYYARRKERVTVKHKSMELPYQFHDPSPENRYDLSDETPRLREFKDFPLVPERQTDSFPHSSPIERRSPSPTSDKLQVMNLEYRPLTKVKFYERKKAEKLKLLQESAFAKPSNHIIHTEIHTDAATQTILKSTRRGRRFEVVVSKKDVRWSSDSPGRYSNLPSALMTSKLSTIAIIHK